MREHEGLPERFGHLLRSVAAGTVELATLGLFLGTIVLIARLLT